MGDTTIKKVNSNNSPVGTLGQKYLVSGVHISMRLWENEKPGGPNPQTTRDFETVGFVLQGRAKLQIEGQTILLEKGDSWLVPKGSSHSYTILEDFSAVEATYPPAQVHGRDEQGSRASSNEHKYEKVETQDEPWVTPGCAEGDLATIEEDIRQKEKKAN